MLKRITKRNASIVPVSILKYSHMWPGTNKLVHIIKIAVKSHKKENTYK
jgi:hypothetical protein